MAPFYQKLVGNSATTVFSIPSGFPKANCKIRVEVNGMNVAFTSTSATSLTLRAAARPGSIVNFYNEDRPTGTGIIGAASLDYPSIPAHSSADLTVSVTGAELGDVVSLGLPSAVPLGLVYAGFVSATNVVTIRATNATIAALDPVAMLFRVKVEKL